MARGRISFNGRSLPNVRNVVREQLTSMKIPNAVKEATDALKAIDISEIKSVLKDSANSVDSIGIKDILLQIKGEFASALSELKLETLKSTFSDSEEILKQANPKKVNIDMNSPLARQLKNSYKSELADSFSNMDVDAAAMGFAMESVKAPLDKFEKNKNGIIESLSTGKRKFDEFKSVAGPDVVNGMFKKMPELSALFSLSDSEFVQRVQDFNVLAALDEVSNMDLSSLGLDL